MSAFETLAPVLQHHVVNDLGWRGLRPVQAETVAPVLAGDNLLVLAPTAGGKTEAAFFPLLTLAERERWRGTPILYLSPIRALLNNQHPRVARYCGWMGRTAAVWHGDTTPGERKRIRRAPPDCLLTTPESIEGMLCSAVTDAEALLGRVRAVVIDEAHGFAAGDRGWHLLAVLERLCELAGHDVQRIALSATVGNVDALRDWLCGASRRARRTVAPGGGTRPETRVTIDHVGTIEGAARVASALHKGEKRLTFCDSRLGAERFAAAVKAAGVDVRVLHGALSADERALAERGFAEARDTMLVATSALELGLDIGDLDRVLQVGAPSTVSSFVQRMGRTGRRPGTLANCLFLATRDEELLRATALVDLWHQGWIEDVAAPPAPLHLVAQQALARLLTAGDLTVPDWRAAVAQTGALFALPPDEVAALAAHLVEQGWVGVADARAFVGPRAEAELGAKHFLELLSVFSAPPGYQVLHGRHALGEVHELSFRGPTPWVLVLAGRGWKVNHLDRRRRRAYVEPAEQPGATRWLGGGPPVSRVVAQAMRRVLLGRASAALHLSKRATLRLGELREEHDWLAERGVQLVDDGLGHPRLWTFAGTAVNAALARRLHALLGLPCRADDVAIDLRVGADSTAGLAARVEGAWEQLQHDYARVPLEEATTPEWGAEKFAACLPAAQRSFVFARREADLAELAATLAEPLRTLRSA